MTIYANSNKTLRIYYWCALALALVSIAAIGVQLLGIIFNNGSTDSEATKITIRVSMLVAVSILTATFVIHFETQIYKRYDEWRSPLAYAKNLVLLEELSHASTAAQITPAKATEIARAIKIVTNLCKEYDNAAADKDFDRWDFEK